MPPLWHGDNCRVWVASQILRNDDDGAEKGSLVWLLDSCATKFGGRLLRDWAVHPLVQHDAILERQDAVQQLLEAQQSGLCSNTGRHAFMMSCSVSIMATSP